MDYFLKHSCKGYCCLGMAEGLGAGVSAQGRGERETEPVKNIASEGSGTLLSLLTLNFSEHLLDLGEARPRVRAFGRRQRLTQGS